MNSGLRTTRGQKVAAGEPNGTAGLAEWRQLLARCGRKPTRKRVHDLRVVTLRIQAEMEPWLHEGERGGRAAPAANRWNKQAEKLRQALGPAREVDVWIGKLAKLRASQAGAEEYIPRSNRESLAQIDKLVDRLKRKRRQLGKKLVAEIEDRRDRMDKFSKDLEEMAEPATRGAGNGRATKILDQFAAVASEFPVLDNDNLHEFRKRIKKVRYLAEIIAASDPEAGRQAAALKKMQSAIGEWHDWEALAKKARRADGDHKKQNELGDLLEALTAESFQKALDVCERIMERLLKQRAHFDEPIRQGQRKPPVRSAMDIVVDQRTLA